MINKSIATINNSGTNNGAQVAVNYGTINLNLSESKKLPSLISSIVKSLSSACIEIEDYDSVTDLSAFKPDEKIRYNDVIKYKQIIIEHSTYFTPCDSIMDIFDDSNLGSKAKILHCVKNWYQECKGQLLLELKNYKETDIEKIRNNSDLLIDSVKAKITDAVYSSCDVGNISIEEISIGITCFTCYCFMKCKILEKPQ